jgi:hypothetical protein
MLRVGGRYTVNLGYTERWHWTRWTVSHSWHEPAFAGVWLAIVFDPLHLHGIAAHWQSLAKMTRMWQALGPSKTKVSLRSYHWNSRFDGTNTRGEGTLNWKGTAKCGGSNAAGIRCYGETKGDAGFSNNPNGGAGCKKDVGNGRWRDRLHWYVRSCLASFIGTCAMLFEWAHDAT